MTYGERAIPGRRSTRRSLRAALVLALAAGCGDGGGCTTAGDNSSSSSGGGGNGGSDTSASSDDWSTGDGYALDPMTSKRCEQCHTSIFKEWVSSPHSASVTSVVTVAQNNALFLTELKDQPRPDPAQFCVNCHSPLVTAAVVTTQKDQVPTLPFNDPSFDPAELTEGIGCKTCHAYIGSPQRGIAGLAVYQDDLDPNGNTFYGPFDDAAETTAHKSQASPSFGKDMASQVCLTCHDTFLDRDHKGTPDKPTPGVDLILQNTGAEFEQYTALGGDKTCGDCHMPVRVGTIRVAEGARIGTDEQQTQAPARTIHSHKLVGVDYPLDDANDESSAERLELLQQGISFDVKGFTFEGGKLAFDVSLANTGTGHAFPTGFAFLRQLFVDVAITDASGALVTSSGHLLNPADDLCDKATFDGPLGVSLSQCPKPDLQLVNLQLQLVTKVVPGVDEKGNPVAVAEPSFAKETVLENLDGGPVVRHRPSDGLPLAPLTPNEKRSYAYHFDLPGQGHNFHVSVKLRFRNLPPYVLRGLRDLSPPQAKDLTKALARLKIIDIATFTRDIQSP